jgi:ferredoxin
MASQLHFVNPETCLGDGICVEICPEDILEIADEKATTVESRADACIECGQCVAVCPTESMTMPKLPTEDFERLPKRPFAFEEFHDFLKTRRSVRVFKDRPVEREVIQKILDAAATAPMGFPPHSTEVVVIDGRDELDFLLEQLVKDYEFMIKGFSNLFIRTMIRLNAGAENFHSLKNYILDVAKHANQVYRENGGDKYMRGAPVLMLFHGSRWAMSCEENAHLICHHSMLAALSLGLGSTIIGLIPPIVDRSRLLRERYGIPKNNRVCTSLVLGYPKYKYHRGIRRDLAGVRYH